MDSNSNNNTNRLPHQDPKPIMEGLKDRYPTVYVEADTSTFKEIVQRLTGPMETTMHGSFEDTPSNFNNNIPPIQTMPEKQQSKLNLYERRNSHRNLNSLLPRFPSDPWTFAPSPRSPNINLSPSSNFKFTALSLAPATPNIPDQYQKRIPNPTLNIEAAKNAIKEKGFFLRPSSANTSSPKDAEPRTPKDAEPRLLPLFPTSPQAWDKPSST